MSTKNSSEDNIAKESTKTAKVKQSYSSKKYHGSVKSYDKVADVVTDQHKKSNGNSSSSKYSKKQAKNLKQQKYNQRKDQGVYMLY